MDTERVILSAESGKQIRCIEERSVSLLVTSDQKIHGRKITGHGLRVTGKFRGTFYALRGTIAGSIGGSPGSIVDELKTMVL